MDRKTPPHKPSSLEVDTSGADALRDRQATASRETAARLAGFARARVENQEKMKQAVRESTERDLFWYQMRWRALKTLLLLLLAYFLASAFFDFVNFVAGIKIILNWFQQCISVAVIYAAIAALRSRLTDEQKQALLRSGKSLSRPFYLTVLVYLGFRGAWAVSSTLVYRSKLGFRLNKPFLYFLITFAFELAACWWLARQRTRAIALLRDINSSLDADEVPAVSRDHLYLVQFIAEGLILNLLLMAVFHFTYGINVPLALAWALTRSPLVFLFGFFPCFAYVFFRKYIQSYSI